MNKYIIPTVACVICLVIGVSAVSTDASAIEDISMEQEAVAESQPTLTTSDFDLKERCGSWTNGAYSTNIVEYNETLSEIKEEAKGSADAAISRYSSILTDEEIENLYFYQQKMDDTDHIVVFEKYRELLDEIIDDCDSRMPVVTSYSYSSSGSGASYGGSSSGVLTKSAGVNFYGGRKETWYSSNDLYHGRTSEWTPDGNGVYRDSDGYVVVAASDLRQGSTVETSYGTGKVYDSGCAAGTTDIYVNW